MASNRDAWRPLFKAAGKEDMIKTIKEVVEKTPEELVTNVPQAEWSMCLSAIGVSMLHLDSIILELTKLKGFTVFVQRLGRPKEKVLGWQEDNLRIELKKQGLEGIDAEDVVEYWRDQKASNQTGAAHPNSPAYVRETPQSVRDAFEGIFLDQCSLKDTFQEYVLYVAKDYRLPTRQLEAYVPYFSLCQSSGYGKSKLIYEMKNSANIYVFYVSLAAENSTSFPPRTTKIANLFQKTKEITKLSRAFFSAVINSLSKYVASTTSPSPAGWADYCTSLIQQEQFYIPEEQEEVSWEFAKMFTKDTAIMIAFDEARALLDDSEATKFRAICRELASIATSNTSKYLGICAVFIDTSISKLVNVEAASKTSKDPSFRGRASFVYDAFYLIATVDIFKELFILGRPLWKAYPSDELRVLIAKRKLMGGSQSWEAVGNADKPYSALAMMASRFCLNVNPLAHAVSSDLVGSYMGTCVGISEDRSTVMVAYPSEPVLAEAAAQLMRNAMHYKEMIATLVSMVKSHIIANAGAAGELVARIILLRCFDTFAESGMVSYAEVPVLSFLARLANLNEAALQKLAEDEKVNKKQDFNTLKNTEREAVPEKENARSCFGGKIAFTHFVGVHYYPNTQHLSIAYDRRVALACEQYREAFDDIIPVKHDNGDYGNIAVKVKNITAEKDCTQGEPLFTPIAKTLTKKAKKISTSGKDSVGLLIQLQATYQPPYFIHNTLVLCGLQSFEHLSPYPEWISHLQNALVAFPDPFAFTKNSPRQKESLKRILGMMYE